MQNLTWYSAAGTSVNLMDNTNYFTLYGHAGDIMPVYEFVSTSVPMQAGETVNQVNVKSRSVEIPVLIKDTTRTLLESRMRTLSNLLNASNGAGRLRATMDDGSQREISCYYRGGLEGNSSKGYITWQEQILSFYAADPYWYAVSPVVNTYTTGTPAVFFPFFPMRLSSSTVFATVTVINSGDSEAYPVWTITGAGTNPVLKNLTTGKTLSLTLTLLTGKVLTIDTRPGYKTIIQAPNTNKFSSISTTSSLWELVNGNNSVQIEMSSADSSSQVVMSYYPRYLTV